MKKILRALLTAALGLLLIGGLTACGGEKHVFTVYADGDFISPTLLEGFTEETGIEVEYIIGERTPEVMEETLFADSSARSAESAIEEALAGPAEQQEEETDPYDDPYAGMSLTEILQRSRDEAIAEAREKAEKKGDTSLGEVEYGPAAYDVVLTDGTALGELVENDLLLQMEYTQVTNAKNIDEAYKALPYDPEGKYTLTTMWGTMGLLWNTGLVQEQLTSWDSLWDEKYAGQILMPIRERDCLGVALTAMGRHANAARPSVLEAAFDKLEAQQPLVAEYAGRDAFILMENNRAALFPCYSGDALAMMSENSALAYLIPTGGAFRVTFGYGIAADTIYPEEAMKFVNYMSSVTSLAKNAVYAHYSVTSEGAKAKLDGSWRGNPIAYPAQSVIAGTQVLSPFPAQQRELCDQRWKKLMAGVQPMEPSAEPAEEGDGSQ